ncbi:MAG: NAD-dependent epimerase/dehydratase family protein [Bdellovibrionia bacterium]
MKVVVAGASGFIGQLLLRELKNEVEWIALGRSVQPAKALPSSSPSALPPNSVTWRACDLFSLLQSENSLLGAEVAIYLVHSMLPRARLTQSSFEDCDLLLADNFARAAKLAGIKRIIYLGGIIPEPPSPESGTEDHLSAHLRSRMEVEQALASTGIPVTTLRAGLILGAEGSSFQMLYLLVRRLPVMICPKWTQTKTQCIDSKDVIDLIRYCLFHPSTTGKTYDIGAPEVLTYQDLMRILAQALGVKRWFLSVRFFTPGLSRLWVQFITGASKNLVRPLVESLRHEMVVHKKELLTLYGKPLKSVHSSLLECVKNIKPTLRGKTRERIQHLKHHPEVRSIQRFRLPAGRTALWVANEYFLWLPRFLAPWIRVEQTEPDFWDFQFLFFKTPLLRLWYSKSRSTRDRQLFYIRGGLLAAKNQSTHARLEFREVLAGRALLAAIHEFKPSLPWPIYQWTQALAHLWVMANFKKHLGKAHSSVK